MTADNIEKILQGDKKAIEEFYTQYSPKIFTYLQKKLPTIEDAEEILHDIFLDALDSMYFFNKKSSISTWLYAIAHNKVVDFYRKKKIKSLLLSQIPFLPLIAQEMHEPEFVYAKNQFRDNIESTLHKLSDTYRNILTLRYEEGLSVKEIALELNLSVKATESLLFRARKDFQKKYETG